MGAFDKLAPLINKIRKKKVSTQQYQKPKVVRKPERLKIDNINLPRGMVGYGDQATKSKILHEDLVYFFLNTYFHKCSLQSKSFSGIHDSGIDDWIEENTSGYWYYEFKSRGGNYIYTFWFENGEDAAHFGLKWC